ncbi:hypothetical protein N656DRAFT_701686 [Canariomyces notabilis]|uniref:Mitochondrial distribution and morphology protein 12 n=1 Tax=Canariomyces notabilis TaxID=2074819 RepID=A0AAN6TMN5_9PEZI|nr:hypothetical protein N656DRAFT_701686 [Canariomyces arenarius]
MSIDLNWETVTGGPDGQELAAKIRDFIHTKFQSVPLPRFIKSVTVHDFQFGSIPPEIELKDITDPLPDFYEDHVDSDLDSDDSENSDDQDELVGTAAHLPDDRRRHQAEAEKPSGRSRPHATQLPHLNFGGSGGPGAGHPRNGDPGTQFLRVSTPGIPGGTSSLHYFHSHLATGLSGTQTPLAAVAGAHHLNTASWLEGHGHSSSVPNLPHYAASFGVGVQQPHPQPSHSRNPSQSSISVSDFSPTVGLTPAPPPARPGVVSGTPTTNPSYLPPNNPSLREKHSVSTLAPTSAGTASRPPTRDEAAAAAAAGLASSSSAIADGDEHSHNHNNQTNPATDSSSIPQPQQQQQQEQPRLRERRIEDVQAVFRIRYAGDVRLLLTADILLDYPMPSFVGIPVRLSITGLTFDGVGVLAKIRKRVHFCFLSPEDAVAAVGGEEEQNGGDDEEEEEGGQHGIGGGDGDGDGGTGGGAAKLGGLLQEIRVESEIGQRESGRQSLRNVGKVERFVLEQVRRIFEEEFVYPSFWTFLI